MRTSDARGISFRGAGRRRRAGIDGGSRVLYPTKRRKGRLYSNLKLLLSSNRFEGTVHLPGGSKVRSGEMPIRQGERQVRQVAKYLNRTEECG